MNNDKVIYSDKQNFERSRYVNYVQWLFNSANQIITRLSQIQSISLLKKLH